MTIFFLFLTLSSYQEQADFVGHWSVQIEGQSMIFDLWTFNADGTMSRVTQQQIPYTLSNGELAMGNIQVKVLEMSKDQAKLGADGDVVVLHRVTKEQLQDLEKQVLVMHKEMRRLSLVGAVLQSLAYTKTAFQVWYDDQNSFSRIDTIPEISGAVMAGQNRVGTGIAKVAGSSYSLIGTSDDKESNSSSITIGFTWSPESDCPKQLCDGEWTLTCYANEDRCAVTIKVGDGSLGLDIGAKP